uniref:Uncharacterized protein n=1 Tax=Octopus bimaculoides TaxID=37653 RepID=A0A0L8FR07_OCTBM
MYICRHLFTYMHICLQVHAFVYISIFALTFRVFLPKCPCMSVCLYMCVRARMLVYICVSICQCTTMHIDLRTLMKLTRLWKKACPIGSDNNIIQKSWHLR